MSNCFLCLEKSKNRICTTCQCCAHSSCWGTYMQNVNKIETFISEEAIIIRTAWSTKCPQCRQKIMTVKPVTRADTELARRIAILGDYISFLETLEYVNTEEELYILYGNMLDSLLIHKELVRQNDILTSLLKRRLRSMYLDGWQPANLYHHRLFGTQCN